MKTTRFPVALLLLLTVIALPLHSVQAQDTPECTEGTVLFEHELLATDPVCIPEAPQRIVTLEPYSFEALYALDIEQAGTLTLSKTFFVANFPDLSSEVEDIQDVGFPPNLELILETQPDLILGTNLPFLADIYDELSAIAPTLLADVTTSGQWQAAQLFFADAVGQPEAMDALFEEYEARLTTFQEIVGDNGLNTEVSVIRVQQAGIAISGAELFPTTVVADAGLMRPDGQLEQDGLPISIEELPAADGDVMFIWSQEATPDGTATAQENFEELRENRLWATLNAVRNDQVYLVGSHWIGYGFVGAHAILDDLFVNLAGVEPAEVSPNPFAPEDESSEDDDTAEVES